MRSEHVLKILVIFVLMGFISSCAPGDDPETQSVTNVVRHYNSLLKRAYLEANLDIIKDVVTENEFRRIYPVIQALRNSGEIIIAEQHSLLIKKVSVRENEAFVETTEKWTYWRQHSRTAQVTEPQKDITYMLRYILLKENGYWKVDKVEDIS